MNIGKKMNTLLPVVEVDEEKCVNCHACITVCPVKYCNDGSGDFVNINHDMCIGCGTCLTRCSHDARYYIDDYDQFSKDLQDNTPIVAIVAPSIVASFGDDYLRINGWLHSLGVEAVFDVSFGAELTVKSYVDHIKNSGPNTVIAQPCPAIVTYLELYKPELLSNLAPVDSPMLHTMKMIHEYYPEYAQHKIAVLSPCLAKRREFQELGMGDYSIAFKTIDALLTENNTPLSSFEEQGYRTPVAERGVLFSSPGGLLETAQRWLPDIKQHSRKIEGVNSVYEYFDSLSEAIARGESPLLIDCLSCEFGCNNGPLSVNNGKSLDSQESDLIKRKNRVQEEFNSTEDIVIQEEMDEVLSKYWQRDLYRRSYQNLSMNNHIFVPDESTMTKIYEQMHKYEPADMYDCSACGYESCENMAIAIHHGLNRPENCHFYMAEEARKANEEISDNEKRLRTILSTSKQGFCLTDENFEIVIVNPTLCTIFGTKNERLVGTSIFKSQFTRCIDSGKEAIEIRIKTPSGGEQTCLFMPSPYYGDKGELEGYFAFITDISEYKHTIQQTTLGTQMGVNNTRTR